MKYNPSHEIFPTQKLHLRKTVLLTVKMELMNSSSHSFRDFHIKAYGIDNCWDIPDPFIFTSMSPSPMSWGGSQSTRHVWMYRSHRRIWTLCFERIEGGFERKYLLLGSRSNLFLLGMQGCVIAQNDTSPLVTTFPWFFRMSTLPWWHFMKVT